MCSTINRPRGKGGALRLLGDFDGPGVLTFWHLSTDIWRQPLLWDSCHEKLLLQDWAREFIKEAMRWSRQEVACQTRPPPSLHASTAFFKPELILLNDCFLSARNVAAKACKNVPWLFHLLWEPLRSLHALCSHSLVFRPRRYPKNVLFCLMCFNGDLVVAFLANKITLRWLLQRAPLNEGIKSSFSRWRNYEERFLNAWE